MTALSNLLNELNVNELSSRQIEAAAEKRGHKLSYATASRYLKGTHPATPSADVLEALAAVFSTDVNNLRHAAGQPSVSDRFELPPEADQLDPDERQAVVNLVRVMAGKKKAGDGNAEATPLTRAGVSPAPEDDGLGSFGGRARGDLDHESINDGAGENVHPLRPDLDNMAAYRTGKETEKQRLLREEAERENESQDPDDWE